jgi:predicted dehydrogenase
MRFGILGCGAVGNKRASALGCHEIVACADADPERASLFARQFPPCQPLATTTSLLELRDIDAVIVCTINSALAPLTRAAVRTGKHVLVEKPAAITSAQLREVRDLAAGSGRVVKVGYNHRYHPALQRAHSIYAEDGVGSLMHIRGRYGHGGRLGYEREWRSDPALAGGGELIDQGTHLIDLARWFAGEFAEVSGHVSTSFWDMPVEDNAFLSLRTAAGQTAWLHASCTEWKNNFSFEVFGQRGKLQVDGLGGSYGVERLTYYRMLPGMGPPETTIWEYPFEDGSWTAELDDFVSAVESRGGHSSTLDDAIATLEIVEMIYRSSGRDYHP